MMKKIGLGLLIATLCVMSCAALAEPGRIDDRLFDTAKQTLHCPVSYTHLTLPTKA